MGGSHQTNLPGTNNLRIHETGGKVHVHDDVEKLKFEMDVKKFKAEYDSLKTTLTAPKPSVFEGKIEDHNGVRLTAERDQQSGQDIVEWKLESDLVPVGGFDEIDDFLSNC